MREIKRLPLLVRVIFPFVKWWPTPSVVYLKTWTQLTHPFGKVRLAMAQEHSLQMRGCHGWLAWFFYRVTDRRQRRQFDFEAWAAGVSACCPALRGCVEEACPSFTNPGFCFFRP